MGSPARRGVRARDPKCRDGEKHYNGGGHDQGWPGPGAHPRSRLRSRVYHFFHDGRNGRWLYFVEDRNVGAFRQFDDDFVMRAVRRIILGDAPAQVARLHADNRVQARIEFVTAAKHVNAQRVFLNATAASGQRFFHHIPQKAAQTR